MLREAFLLLVLSVAISVKQSAAQNIQHKLDSLTARLPHAKEDTNKVLLLCAISAEYFGIDPDEGIRYGEKALALANELKFDYGFIKSNNVIARCYGIQNNYPLALHYYQAALAKAREKQDQRIIAILTVSLGAIYTSHNDFDMAHRYLMEAKEAYKKAGITNTVSLFTNLGHLYSRQGKRAKALEYYKQGIQQEEEAGRHSADLAILYSNAGGIYMEEQDHGNALSYLFKALAMHEATGNIKSMAYTMHTIGATYAHGAEASATTLPDSLRYKPVILARAEYYLTRSLALCKKLGIREIEMSNYLELANVYAAKNDYQKAYTRACQYSALKDTLFDLKEQQAFAQIEAEYKVQKTTDSLKYIAAVKDSEVSQRKLERNGSILVLSLGSIISLLLVNRQKLKQKQGRKLAEAERVRAEEMAKQQLADFTQSIQEKNTLIEKFSAEITRYQTAVYNDQPETNNSLEELQSAVILTEEQWVNFQSLFDKVHSGYIARTKERHPALTAAELRFIVLSKLELSNKEMAAMLGVSLEAVRTNKHRLLKKLNLSEGVTLYDTVHSI